MEWLMNLNPTVLAALIAAIASVIVTLIKVIIPSFKKSENNSTKKVKIIPRKPLHP